ncbi:Ig-like domain-containing protein [Prescottella subtropica]|uniref:Ig-like domain-containing protein n=1 Tax=Prescottella subtropica TaxID=2545757 RepID=UPI0010F4B843|nr:Ig-like domain-containing protein [Prescottella subtropica]
MSDKNVRRVVGGLSAFAIAAGFAVTAGVGAANAESKSVPWDDAGRHFTRTISNVTPTVGETITSTTRLERTRSVENVYAMKDVHPTCLEYVPGSAKVNGQARTPESTGADFVRVEGGLTEWPVQPRGGALNPKSWTLEVSYVVGEGCDRGTALMTTAHMGGGLGDGTYQDKGPTISVAKSNTTTSLGAVSGAKVGEVTKLSATVAGGIKGDPVDFYVGNNKVGSGTLNAQRTATFDWTPSIKGTVSVQAKFAGTAKSNASESAAQNVNVTQANVASSTTLAAVSGAKVGQGSALTATVTPAGAGGTVEFKDGSTSLAKVSVDADGKATYQWTPTTVGSHTITAEFSGRDGVNASTATGIVVEVAEKPAENADSKTEVTAGGGKVGVAQTLSAKVAGAAGGIVTFKVGDRVVGTANVGNDGNASISWTPAAAGDFIVTAEYSGTNTVNSSSDTASVVIAQADNGGDGGTDGGDTGTGSLGSLGNIFGSLTGIFGSLGR